MTRVDAHMESSFWPLALPSVSTVGTQLDRWAYRAQQWETSEALWRRLLALVPEERISALYLERIAANRESPPPAEWDGSVALDKL